MGKGGKGGKILFTALGFAIGAGAFGASFGGFAALGHTAIVNGLAGASLAGSIWSATHRQSLNFNFNPPEIRRFDVAQETVSSVQQIPVVYGFRKISGNQVYHKVNGDQQQLEKHVILCEGEVNVKTISVGGLDASTNGVTSGTCFILKNIKDRDASAHKDGHKLYLSALGNKRTLYLANKDDYQASNNGELWSWQCNIGELIKYINSLGDGWQAFPIGSTTGYPGDLKDFDSKDKVTAEVPSEDKNKFYAATCFVSNNPEDVKIQLTSTGTWYAYNPGYIDLTNGKQLAANEERIGRTYANTPYWVENPNNKKAYSIAAVTDKEDIVWVTDNSFNKEMERGFKLNREVATMFKEYSLIPWVNESFVSGSNIYDRTYGGWAGKVIRKGYNYFLSKTYEIVDIIKKADEDFLSKGLRDGKGEIASVYQHMNTRIVQKFKDLTTFSIMVDDKEYGFVIKEQGRFVLHDILIPNKDIVSRDMVHRSYPLGRIRALGCFYDIYENGVPSKFVEGSALVSYNVKSKNVLGSTSVTVKTTPPQNYEETGGYPGVTWLDCKLTTSADLSGNPTIECGVEGIRVFDTRIGKKKYSSNPAMCVRDFLLNRTYGLGEYFKPEDLDEESFKEIANYCDEIIEVESQKFGKEKAKRFELNMVIDQPQNALDWLSMMLGNFNGFLTLSKGKVALKVMKREPVSYKFNDGNCSDLSVATIPLANSPNRFEVSFVDPLNNWKAISAVVEDFADQQQRGKTITKKVSLEGTTSYHQAIRLARYHRDLNTLCPLTITFKTGQQAAHLEPGDVIEMSFHNVFQGAKFRIQELKENGNGTFEINARQYSDALFNEANNVSLEMPSYSIMESSLNNEVLNVSDISTTVDLNTINPTNYTGDLKITYTIPPNTSKVFVEGECLNNPKHNFERTSIDDTLIVKGLTLNDRYRLKFTTMNDVGRKSLVKTVDNVFIKTSDGNKPKIPAPINGTFWNGVNELDTLLLWERPLSDGANVIAKYMIVDTSNNNKFYTTETKYSLQIFDKNVRTYKVYSLDSFGNQSKESLDIVVQSGVVLSPPYRVNAIQDSNNLRRFTITWNEVPYKVKNYVVKCSLFGDEFTTTESTLTIDVPTDKSITTKGYGRQGQYLDSSQNTYASATEEFNNTFTIDFSVKALTDVGISSEWRTVTIAPKLIPTNDIKVSSGKYKINPMNNTLNLMLNVVSPFGLGKDIDLTYSIGGHEESFEEVSKESKTIDYKSELLISPIPRGVIMSKEINPVKISYKGHNFFNTQTTTKEQTVTLPNFLVEKPYVETLVDKIADYNRDTFSYIYTKAIKTSTRFNDSIDTNGFKSVEPSYDVLINGKPNKDFTLNNGSPFHQQGRAALQHTFTLNELKSLRDDKDKIKIELKEYIYYESKNGKSNKIELKTHLVDVIDVGKLLSQVIEPPVLPPKQEVPVEDRTRYNELTTETYNNTTKTYRDYEKKNKTNEEADR